MNNLELGGLVFLYNGTWIGVIVDINSKGHRGMAGVKWVIIPLEDRDDEPMWDGIAYHGIRWVKTWVLSQ